MTKESMSMNKNKDWIRELSYEVIEYFFFSESRKANEDWNSEQLYEVLEAYISASSILTNKNRSAAMDELYSWDEQRKLMEVEAIFGSVLKKEVLYKIIELTISAVRKNKEVYDNGYTWEGMKKISPAEALERFENGDEVFILYEDDTEGAVEEICQFEVYGSYGIDFQ
jgi:hypothetical protein